MLYPHGKVDYRSDHSNFEQENGVMTMEGDVRIYSTAARLVSGTPYQQMATELGQVIVEADKVVISRQVDGGTKLEIKNGSIWIL